MSYPYSPSGLSSLTKHQLEPDGFTYRFAGFGVANDGGSNGILYGDFFYDSRTEQLGYVYVTGSNNALGIWKVPKNSQPPLPGFSRYDCLNGSCIPSGTYSTPGIYESLEECEVNCGGQGCSGKCLTNAEWAAIVGRSENLKNINCK
jgi:hypothetical protein